MHDSKPQVEREAERVEAVTKVRVNRRTFMGGAMGGAAALGAAGLLRGVHEADAAEAEKQNTAFASPGHGTGHENPTRLTPQTVPGAVFARRADGQDINDAINKALDKAGPGGVVIAEPGDYTVASGDPVNTPAMPAAPDQTLIAYGVKVEVDNRANGAIDTLPLNNGGKSRVYGKNSSRARGADGFHLYGGTWLANRNYRNHEVTSRGAAWSRSIVSVGHSRVVICDAAVGYARRGLEVRDGSDVSILDCYAFECANAFTFVHTKNSHATGLLAHKLSDTGFLFERCDACSATITADFSPYPGSFGFDCFGSRNCTGIGTFSSPGTGQPRNVRKAVFDHVYNHHHAPNRISEGNTWIVTAKNIRNYGVQLHNARGCTVRANVDGLDSEGNIRGDAALRISGAHVDDPGHDIEIQARNFKAVTRRSGNAGTSRIRGTLRNIRGDGNFHGPVDLDLRLIDSPAHLRIQSPDARVRTHRTFRAQTNNKGQVTVHWGDEIAFGKEHKPHLSVQIEQPGGWYVARWSKDSNGEYDGATVKITNPDGSSVGEGQPVVLQL